MVHRLGSQWHIVAELDQDMHICEYLHVNLSANPSTVPPVSQKSDCSSPMVSAAVSEKASAELASVFKALSDPCRVRLLSLISGSENQEACVCDLNESFDLSQPTISRHLKILADAGLVTRDKRGVWVYYRANNEALVQLADFLWPSQPRQPIATIQDLPHTAALKSAAINTAKAGA